MTLIVWNDEYSVGVNALDRDHIIIFSLINHIHEACQSGGDEIAVARLLDVLKDYALGHFRLEEALFERHDYGDRAEHQAAHQAIAEELDGLHQAYLERPSPAVAADIVELLAFWLRSHILNEDMGYKELLAEAADETEGDDPVG